MAQAAEVRSKLEAIKTEMTRLGMWEIQEPAADAYENMGAFGMNTMAFPQWLRWVFVPRVESLLESDGPWPPSSSVGAHAIRELDGYWDASDLVSLLNEFDDLF